MKIIVLYGPKNTGKTATLKRVLAALERQLGAVSVRLIDAMDILAVILIGDLRIGIETEGDPRGRLPVSLDRLIEERCQLIICASRTKGGTVKAITSRANPQEIRWIRKISAPAEKDHAEIDVLHADKILAAVFP